MSMKKSITAVSFILAVLMVITMLTACADNSIPAQTTPAAPTVEAAPAESAQPVDPLVGAWRFPPSPYGDDFSVYVVLNADGSFYNATNLYQNGSVEAKELMHRLMQGRQTPLRLLKGMFLQLIQTHSLML